MGDKSTLIMAQKELENLYSGVPDDSVNLTFKDLAQVRQFPKPEKVPARLPSLDFSKGLEAASFQGSHTPPPHHHHHHHESSFQTHAAYDDDEMSNYGSVVYGGERGGRRRPGIPHSNICTICTTYIYICRHRCLVCGRVYCRQCVSMGMGEMTEGRKCIACLGRRFSQRYIHKAGNVGCCMGYSSAVKQQELKWAEQGTRRTGNRHGMMASRSRSPIGSATPTRASNPPSFIMNSPNNHHPMPF